MRMALFCMALCTSVVAMELLTRWTYPPLEHPSSMIPDSLLGWDISPPLSSSRIGGDTAVYFVGDSFTVGQSWPQETQAILERSGIAIVAHNLGVAGYGTLQEFLKVQRHFPAHSPPVVILQFFAWNDLRDNVGSPAVFYSPHRMQRPYLVEGDGEWILQKPRFPFLSSFLSHSSLYVHHILPHFLAQSHALLQQHGIDAFVTRARPAHLSYTESKAWDPFYRGDSGQSLYVTRAYAVTEEILRRMQQYLAERGSLLIVIGLDAAFTVDEDVRRAYVSDSSSFHGSLPLARIGELCEKHGIPFINALPHLRREAQRLQKKIYNGPQGNLSGHLEPEGNAILARLVAEAIRKHLRP